MKKVLIIAYDFPPYVSVGGLRPYSWYKYFHEFGLYPVVVTRQWDNKYGNHLDYIAPGESNETIVEESETGTIIRTPYKPNLSNRLLLKYGEKRFRLLRKAITAYYEFMQFLFFVGPKAGLYRGAKRYLKQHKVDAIIATGEPFILFKYAAKLNKKYNIPWVADYRDPWTQNSSRSTNLLLKMWNGYFEKRYLSEVKHITTVSDFFKNQIRSIVKGKPFSIIYNGYNLPTAFKEKAFTPKSDKLRIAFAGSIYPWHPWKSVLQCLAELDERNSNDFELTFYGINQTAEIKQYLEKYLPDLKKSIKFYPKLDNQNLLFELSKHHGLLLFNDYSIAGTKIYDYLAVKRRILLCYTNDSKANKLKEAHFPLPEGTSFNQNLQQEIIAYTESGYAIQNSEELHAVLLSLHQELQENRMLPCHSVHIEDFSRKKQTERLAALIS
ncbi:MAG: glycosyltransferase [bacterium]